MVRVLMVYSTDQGREGGHDVAQGIGADLPMVVVSPDTTEETWILDFGFTRADFGTDLAISNRT
ncbi:hypothetical protein M8C21_023863 [Ambrosia artemisiifolia]|uniref:Uncharacterized protein n=1 Tax=Ambrosia artemisiifolia TaxID=4212 RepID=A0AAD5GD38_AMBAR|nr:hypothetical protein M8C21_023863 [Ambrosia artemisiifolia]